MACKSHTQALSMKMVKLLDGGLPKTKMVELIKAPSETTICMVLVSHQFNDIQNTISLFKSYTQVAVLHKSVRCAMDKAMVRNQPNLAMD